MDGKSIWLTVQHILRDRKIKLSLEQYNRYYQLTNEELKNIVYGRVGEQQGFETEHQITDDLLPFKTTSVVALTVGSGTLPADYWHKVYMEVVSSGVEVEILESREFSRRKNSEAAGASTYYPICQIKDGTISVYPTSIASVNFTYLKTGNTPAVAIKSENGILVYDSDNSVEPEWNDNKYMDFIRVFVSLLSVPMTNEDLLSYTEQKVDKEN